MKTSDLYSLVSRPPSIAGGGNTRAGTNELLPFCSLLYIILLHLSINAVSSSLFLKGWLLRVGHESVFYQRFVDNFFCPPALPVPVGAPRIAINLTTRAVISLLL